MSNPFVLDLDGSLDTTVASLHTMNADYETNLGVTEFKRVADGGVASEALATNRLVFTADLNKFIFYGQLNTDNMHNPTGGGLPSGGGVTMTPQLTIAGGVGSDGTGPEPALDGDDHHYLAPFTPDGIEYVVFTCDYDKGDEQSKKTSMPRVFRSRPLGMDKASFDILPSQDKVTSAINADPLTGGNDGNLDDYGNIVTLDAQGNLQCANCAELPVGVQKDWVYISDAFVLKFTGIADADGNDGPHIVGHRSYQTASTTAGYHAVPTWSSTTSTDIILKQTLRGQDDAASGQAAGTYTAVFSQAQHPAMAQVDDVVNYMQEIQSTTRSVGNTSAWSAGTGVSNGPLVNDGLLHSQADRLRLQAANLATALDALSTEYSGYLAYQKFVITVDSTLDGLTAGSVTTDAVQAKAALLTQSIVEAITEIDGSAPPAGAAVPQLNLPAGLYVKVGAGKGENISVTSAGGATVDILVTDGSKDIGQGGLLVPYIVQA